MKKGTALLLFLFSLMWYFNFCTPLICDDYVYAFVWQDNAMGIALPESAERVSGFMDIIYSQWKHYFSWGGRTIAHSLAQLFLWLGKDLFNFLNAGCFILLLLEMQWMIHGGKISFIISAKDILWLFGTIWIFTVYLGDIFIWVTLSCNYLWTTAVLLAFMLIYERHYFSSENKPFERKSFSLMLFFIFGMIAGWTNENVPCFLILIIGLYIFKLHKERNEINWFLVSGLLGMVLGYILLVAAPGNYVRYARQVQDHIVTPGISLLQDNLLVLVNILLLRLILIYYVLRSLIVIRRKETSTICQKLFNVSQALLVLSLASSAIMVFSPYYRYRSSFAGLVFLLIAVGIIRRVRSMEGLDVKDKSERIVKFERAAYRILHVLGIVYISITLIGTLYIGTLQYQQTQRMLSEIKNAKQLPPNNVLTVRERPKWTDEHFFEAFVITGGHLSYPYSLTSDENCWINRDVALYYGIRLIRSGKEEELP